MAQPLTFTQRCLVAVGGCVLGGLSRSLRFRRVTGTAFEPVDDTDAGLARVLGDDGAPAIFAFWHANMFPLLHLMRGRGIGVMISASPDGRILARLLEKWGFQPVFGSSTRGGGRAFRGLTRVLEQGHHVAVTIDGPLGPAHIVKPGVIHLASVTGRPLVPTVTTAKRYWRFQSWDRFRLPLPFTRTLCAIDEPMRVPGDADRDELESIRVSFEERMRRFQQACDEHVQPRIWRLPDRRPRDQATWRE